MYYTVIITTKYVGAKPHTTIDDALARMGDTLRRAHMSIVLRDGATGKRYSFAEAQHIQFHQQLLPDPGIPAHEMNHNNYNGA